ncbi:MAG: SRPBCC family protein [Spirochaetales bacterium]|nr:SRPBCC family protein [Spirochaetales bacterium]
MKYSCLKNEGPSKVFHADGRRDRSGQAEQSEQNIVGTLLFNRISNIFSLTNFSNMELIMKYAGSIEIDKPIEMVTKLFADSTYLKEYQDGFVKKDLMSGQQGKEGAISKMYYKYGKADMILIETIVLNKLPSVYEAHYHHKHMDNTMKCHFTSLDTNRTRYEYEYEYTRINWIMPKLMAILFPNMYRKQGEKWISQFKEFVEQQ